MNNKFSSEKFRVQKIEFIVSIKLLKYKTCDYIINAISSVKILKKKKKKVISTRISTFTFLVVLHEH